MDFLLSKFNKIKKVLFGTAPSIEKTRVTPAQSKTKTAKTKPLNNINPKVEKRGFQTTKPREIAQKNKPIDFCEIRIGVDFGTSFTKVVASIERLGYVVVKNDFNSEPCLFPSKFYINNEKEFSLIKTSGCAEITDLKLQLIQTLNQTDSKIYKSKQFYNAAVYLELILRHTINYIIVSKKRELDRFDLKWGLTLGFPSAPDKKDYSKVEKIFRSLAQVAFSTAISNEVNPNKISNAIKLMAKSKGGFFPENKEFIDDEKEWAMTYPEILSQVVLLNNPDLQIKGQQILIDIGAGTVDTVFFSKHKSKSQGEKISIYDASVNLYGAHKLHQNRINNLEELFEKYTFSGQIPDKGDNTNPYDTKNYFDKTIDKKEIKSKIASIDGNFFKKVESQVLKLFRSVIEKCLVPVHPKNKEYRNQSFFLILSGGGSNINFYKNLIHIPFSKIRKSNVKYRSFPVPQNVTGLDENNKEKLYHRLSVAFGLAVSPINLPEIRTQVMEQKKSINKSGGKKSGIKVQCKLPNCSREVLKGKDRCYVHCDDYH